MSLPVLLWKNYLSRKKRFVHTAVELSSTVLLLLVVFFSRIFVIPSVDLLRETDISSTTTVFYTPVSNTTRSIMVNVARTLGKPFLQFSRRFDYEYDVRNDTIYVSAEKFNGSGIIGLQNVSESDITELTDDSHAFVIFQDTEDSISKRINYKIRSMDISEEELRLQRAINKSYLERRSNRTLAHKITLQKLTEVSSSVSENASRVSLIIVTVLYYVTFMCLMLPFIFLIIRTIDERVNGLQELLKMAGVSYTEILASHMLNVLPTGLVFSLVGAMLLKISSQPMIPATNFFFIFLPRLLHFYTLMLAAMVCSFVLNTAQYRTAVACVMFFVLIIPGTVLEYLTLPRGLRLLTGIIPYVPFSWYHKELAALEAYGQGISFSTMTSSHSDVSMSVLVSLLWWLVQLAVYGALVVVLSRARPGPYGSPQPVFTWGKKRVEQDISVTEQEEPMARDPNYFEDPPSNKDVGVRIHNVSKIFGTNKTHALSNVSFDVFHGEITVLLGHNGAGKTTLLSIITGMLTATSGKVYVNGLDIASDQSKVRKQIGLCTQHNLFFPDMTILEHVMFFSMLKGQKLKEARMSSLKLLEELGIVEKDNENSTALSGGMQRRLQLACALAGGSTVLVLDEPTSGLDVQTRRELWDLLLALRGTRTVLLTTHFMEEADALGDRVAALHEGTLRCHATPMHLKKHIGSGYRLTLSTIGFPREHLITSTVTSSVPDATLRQQDPTTITYDLPARSTAQFPGLFQRLEDSRMELGVESIGVGMPTLH